MSDNRATLLMVIGVYLYKHIEQFYYGCENLPRDAVEAQNEVNKFLRYFLVLG